MLTSLSMVGMEICSKIWGLPNVWSSDLPVCSMFLNFRTLGRSWDPLGRSRDALGVLLGTLGELLGRSWVPLGRSWGTLGRSWDVLGALLDASWTQLGKKVIPICFLGSNLEAKIHPSWLQNPGKIDIETNVDFEAIFSHFFHVFHRFPRHSKNHRFCKK